MSLTSHQLAHMLLAGPDLPVATHAHDRTYAPYHGENPEYAHDIKVGVMKHPYGEYVLLGNMNTKALNPNWYVTRMITPGDLPG